MDESPTRNSHSKEMLGGAVALRLGAALLAGMALVLALAIMDRQRRAQIEGWEEVTAVGDGTFFVPPADSAAAAVVKWEAGVLKVATGERTKLRDTQMRRAGSAEAGGVTIYRQGSPSIPESAARLYVKVAPGEYLPAAAAEK